MTMNSSNEKNTERDINDIFDDIVLAEDKLREEGYKEGYVEGCARGNKEGYQLGYAQGVQLGRELGQIYGIVIAELQVQHSEKVKRTLSQLKAAIDEFPRENEPDKDIIGAVEHIRNLNKRFQAMLSTKSKLTKELPEETNERKDYTF